MYINLFFIKQQLQLRKKVPIHNAPVGSMIKYQRKKLKMTLNEGAEGICSVSYLSKVENNLIEPSPKFIQSFKERFYIEEKEHYDYKVLFDQVVAQFYFNEFNDKINIGKQKDHHLILLCMMQSLFKKDYEQAFHDYVETVNFIKNYHQVEIAFYLYGISLLLSHQGYFKEALEMISEVDPWIENHMHLKSLVLKQRLIMAFEMNHHTYLMTDYQGAIKSLLATESYHIVAEIKEYYYVYMSRYLKQKKLKQELEYANLKQDHFEDYILAHHAYHEGNYEETIQRLEHKNLDKEAHVSILLKAMSRSNAHDKIKQYLRKPHCITSNDYKQFVKYVLIKAVQKADAIEYLQEEILHHKLLTDRHELLIFWYEEVMLLLPTISFYKEATLFAQRIMRKIRQTK